MSWRRWGARLRAVLTGNGPGADGQIVVGQTGLDALWKTLSGDATLSAAGALTLDNDATARSNLGLGTADSPQFAAVNVGHASDTTLARSGAGDLSVEGNAIYRAGGTDVPVADGGTGVSTLADGGLLVGNAAGAIQALAAGTNGQIPIGQTGADPVMTTLSGAGTLGATGILSLYEQGLLSTTASTVLAESIPIWLASAENGFGTLRLSPVLLRNGSTAGRIRFCSGATAMVTPTNWWFALYDGGFNLLEQTADQGAAAWAANTIKTIALSANVAISTTGIYYAAIFINAVTPPSILRSPTVNTAITGLTGSAAYGFGYGGTAPDPAVFSVAITNVNWCQVLPP